MRRLVALGLLVASEAGAQSAVDEFRLACATGDSWSCRELGVRYLIGRVSSEDPASAVRSLLSRACDADDALACYNLAVAHHRGEVLEEDEPAALALYERACDLGDAPSCSWVGFAKMYGQLGSVRDLPASREALEAACGEDDADGWGCHLLGLQTLTGVGGPPDAARAEELLLRGCRRGWAPACEARLKARKKARASRR